MTTPSNPADLDELERLEKAALAAPWHHVIGYGIGGSTSVRLEHDGEPNAEQRLAIALRNAAPELIREARFARKAAAFLASHREDLLMYLTVTLGEASAALAEYREP